MTVLFPKAPPILRMLAYNFCITFLPLFLVSKMKLPVETKVNLYFRLSVSFISK